MNHIAVRPDQSFKNLLHCEDSEGNWIAPRVITSAMQQQALAILADYPSRLAPAEMDGKRRWLASIAVASAGKMSSSEAEKRLALYADLLDHEAGCFTKSSLARAAAKFKWFPSFAEVKEELDAERRRLYVEADRLKRMANPPASVPPREPPTQEQQERVAAAIREAGIAINVTP
ncbi:MAG: hypothetical protein KG075_17480 [Alphaproteobacteria bacterium]|nr:hypothetical protein [Alphaproteobacteria bacterium]